MTSEVLILNKRAVVLAADSAVTSSGDRHPRYSKSANKIFDLTDGGFIAAAIFGSASIDTVPWELVIKLFRRHLGGATFGKTEEYMTALTNFLSGNNQLFPASLRDSFVEQQFDNALVEILKHTKGADGRFVDLGLALADRQASWATAAADLRNLLDGFGIAAPLSQQHLDAALAEQGRWVPRAQQQLDQVPTLQAVNAVELTELGHKLRYARPDLLLGNTGLVVAGYGEDDIFPSFRQVAVYGHVGSELCFTETNRFDVQHGGTAMIQPLAQTSMIDMFTDGFGASLASIIEDASRTALQKVVDELIAAGVQIPLNVAEQVTAQSHTDFMKDWKRENWKKNYTPLINVIATLDVQEMAHLAETLLVLESLKERVTSPSESVGGPIDVAAITKGEGLIWIKRKHFFDGSLNMRYASRVRHSLDHRGED